MNDIKRMIGLPTNTSPEINNDLKRILGFMSINPQEIYEQNKKYGLSIYDSTQQKWIFYSNKLPLLYNIKSRYESTALSMIFFNVDDNNKPIEMIRSFHIDRDQGFDSIFKWEESMYIVLKDESYVNSPNLELPKLCFEN
jgi:hypothetical protein